MSKTIMVTPVGTANYCWISRPDTTFNPDGTYQTNLILDKENLEVKSLCKILKQAYTDSQKPKKKKGKAPYWTNDAGDIEMKFAQKSVIRTKAGEEFKKTVAVLDSKNKPCKLNIGRGTTMKVAFEIAPYDYNGCGITLRLKAVQVLELVEYDGGQEFGFEEEDGGFESTDKEDIVDEEEDVSTDEFDEDDSGDEDDDDSPF